MNIYYSIMPGRVSQKIFITAGYLKYLFSARSAGSIHSPFVFELYRDVIQNKSSFPGFRKVEELRSSLLRSSETIDTIDLGAGSNILSTKKKKISSIVKSYSKTEKYGRLLFRLADFFKPEKILELGTSLGLSTAYLASPSGSIRVTTLEGCPETADAARKNFKKISLENIEVITGNFNDTLSAALKKTGNPGLVFFDGNHRKEPTLRYFRECLEHSSAGSVFIFDDIHWSEEMEDAWIEIKKHSTVTCTIDLFFLGLVFFRKEMTKQDFVLRF